MKRISLIIIVLCLWQTGFGQEKTAKEQRSSKVEKAIEKPLIIKAQHDVNLKIEKEEEDKNKPKIVFGESITYPYDLDEHFDHITLYELKRPLTKKFYNFEFNLDFNSLYDLHVKTKRISNIDFEPDKGNTYLLKVPALKANRYYFLVTESSGKDIIEIFELMYDEGNETCCGEIKDWMRKMQKLSKSRGEYPLYYYPTLSKLNSFQAIIKEQDLDSLSKDDLLKIVKQEFPVLRFPARSKKDNVTAENANSFSRWINGRETLNTEDTWIFGDPTIGIGIYYDYDGLYDFYINYVHKDLEKFKVESKKISKETERLERELQELEKNFLKSIKKKIRKAYQKEISNKKEEKEKKNQELVLEENKFIKKINERINEKIENDYNKSIAKKDAVDFERYKNDVGYLPNYLKDIESIAAKVSTISTHPLNFEKSFKRSLVPDFGLLVNRFPGNEYRGLPYVGVHIPFAPVNRDVSMAQSRLSFSQRTSLHVGITLSSIAEDNIRDDLFNNYSLMLGFGHKVIHHALRLNTGVVAYNKIDAVNGDKSFALTPYLGLSIDIEIRRWLEEIIPSFTGNFKKAE